MGNYQEMTLVEGARKVYKNLSLHFKEHFTNIEDDISLIFLRFFFCPTNLIFKFN